MVFEILRYGVIGSALVGLIIGIFRFGKLQKEMKMIALLFLISITTEALSYYLQQNITILSVYTLVELLLFSLFYFFIIQRNSSIYLYTLIALSILTYGIVDVLIQVEEGLKPVFMASTNLFFIVTSIYILINTYFAKKKWRISGTEGFTLKVLFAYFTVTIIAFLLSNWFLQHDKELFKELWILNNSAVLITNILLSIALWKSRTLKISSTSLSS